MKIYKMEELSWYRVRELARAGALFLQGVSPLEDHGPHLPSGVDFLLVDRFVDELARLVRDKPLPEQYPAVVICPTLPLGASRVKTLPCIRTSPKVLKALLYSHLNQFQKMGVERMLLLSVHGALVHLDLLQEVAVRWSRSQPMQVGAPSKTIMLSFLSGAYQEEVEEFLGEPLEEEKWKILVRDYHAGAWETSLMLYFYPDLVGDFYQDLDDFIVDHRKWKAYLQLFQHQGWFGAPRLAGAKLGGAASYALKCNTLVWLKHWYEQDMDFCYPQERAPSSSKKTPLVALGLLGLALGTLGWYNLKQEQKRQALEASENADTL